MHSSCFDVGWGGGRELQILNFLTMKFWLQQLPGAEQSTLVIIYHFVYSSVDPWRTSKRVLVAVSIHRQCKHPSIPSIGLSVARKSSTTTLTSRTVVHDLVTEDVAVDTKVVSARLTLVPTRLAGPFGRFCPARRRAVV